MLRELFEANEEGHRKKLTGDHFDTIFDAVAHQELDMERIKEMSHELGDGEDYDRTKGGAYFAMMRMYAVCHGAPPDGDIIGGWWKDVPPGFIEYAEANGIHNARENVVKATGIAEHKVKQQHEAKGAAKAGKARANALMAAKKTFEDRWGSLKATVSPPAAKKAVELAKNEIVNDMADGTKVHAAIAKVVSQHGGIMEAAKTSFINYLVEGDVVDASDRFAKKKTDDCECTKCKCDPCECGDAGKKKRDDYNKKEAERKAAKKKKDDERRAKDSSEFKRKQEEQKILDDNKKKKNGTVEEGVVDAKKHFAQKRQNDTHARLVAQVNAMSDEEVFDKAASLDMIIYAANAAGDEDHTLNDLIHDEIVKRKMFKNGEWVFPGFQEHIAGKQKASKERAAVMKKKIQDRKG